MPSGLGRLCLNFVATVAERRSAYIERLRSPSDLAAWLLDAGLLDRRPKPDEKELELARRLREAIYRLVSPDVVAASADIRLVNTVAKHSPPIPLLSSDGLRRRLADQSVAGGLAVIARDAIELLASPERQRIRTCEADGCGAPFLDASRPGTRRWCYMGACGNRAKKSAFRQRQRRASSRNRSGRSR